jgi:uridine kinase
MPGIDFSSGLFITFIILISKLINMLGDILNINEQHIAAAEAITKRILSDAGKMPKAYKYAVGISGETLSGKSEISRSIAILLKKQHVRVKILHSGNYYKIPPLLMTEWRKNKGIDSVGINEYDWNLLNRNVQDFKEDRESMLPLIDVVPEQVDKLITDFKKIDLLILTGLYAIKADGMDIRIFFDMDCSESIPSGTGSDQKPPDEFSLKVLEKERMNVHLLKNLADLIVTKGYQVIDARTGESLM